MEQSIIITQISFLTVLVLIGFVSSKIGIIKAETRDSLVKIIFNITLPLLLFTNFSKLDLTPEILKNSLVVIVISFLIIITIKIIYILKYYQSSLSITNI